MDSNDRDRVVEARDELHRMLNEVLLHFLFWTNLLYIICLISIVLSSLWREAKACMSDDIDLVASFGFEQQSDVYCTLF